MCGGGGCGPGLACGLLCVCIQTYGGESLDSLRGREYLTAAEKLYSALLRGPNAVEEETEQARHVLMESGQFLDLTQIML